MATLNIAYTVAPEVLDAVRRHAVEVDRDRPGYESLGALVLDRDRRVLRYSRMTNGARRPNRVRLASERQLHRPGGLPLVVVHSHALSDAVPSDADRVWVTWNGWDIFAIFSVVTDELRFWRLDGNGFADVPHEIAS